MTNLMQDFQRDLSYKISFDAANNIVLTGTLEDSIHDIVAEFVIEQEHLEIVEAIAKFNRSPTNHCCKVEERMKRFIGVRIKTGVSRAIIRILGSSEGCGNLRTMVMGLLPLAINAKAGAAFNSQAEILNAIQQKLTGTCAGYPEEG